MMSSISTSRSASHGTPLLLIASMGCAMTVLDTNVVGIVLPGIARDLNASFADIEWVISAYVLCFAALLLPAGSLADRYGRKRVFLLGIALFAAASLACSVVRSATLLYIARSAQGVGAAFLLAPALAIIGHAFHHEHERTRAWAVWGGIMGLTMVLSPLIGGLISAWLGWRWAFAINVPICGLLATGVVRIVDESRDPTTRALDLPGIALFAAAMFSLTWALILGPEHGWFSAAVALRACAGVVLFALFVWMERRRAHPMLDLALFRSLPFVGAIVAMFAYASSAQVMASLLPLFLQNAHGETALSAGVGMLPFALAMLLLPQLGRKLAERMDSRQILTLGLAVVACGNLAMTLAARSTDHVWLMVAMALLGSGGGLLNGETQKAIMGTVPRERAGMASGISTTSRFTGILLGFSGLGAVLAEGVRSTLTARMAQTHLPFIHGFAERVMAGDFARAFALYPPASFDALVDVARSSYGEGFAHAFYAAASVAAVSAAIVFLSMRRKTGQSG
ncbi:MFS transporter [Paraburkholderia phymatum]|uniref:Major facilitator superfamily MFS_1 n=1 Tax=Paraburkholderia phymatum (strain DSM 17167 / CIP 108236 / LMG 21445 / STM815) TaxID=391038 RepID=B2JM31_PARP8|nr:MFS transporter [Paraburkholderia phymatum]ACC72721.1 major facilitator superfamily MFS_1 [Paraburkholderia phymatum STM815]